MADDIAVLGIKIDSTQVEKADSDLDQLTASSKKAEDATESLSSETKKAGQAFTSYGLGINDSLKVALKFNKTSKSIENQLAKEIARVKGGEQAYRELSAAQRLGLKSAEQLPPAIRNQIAQLVRLKKEAKEAASAQRELERSGSSYGNSLDATGKKQAEFGRRAGQASVQLEQLIGQIASGGNPVQAFAFQVADLGIVLGAPLLGAIAGISASLVNLLLPALLNNKDATEELKESISELIGQVKLEAEELELLANVRDKDNKRLAESNKELEQQIKDLTSLNSLRKEAVENPVTTTDELILQQKYTEQIEETSKKILELKNQIIANKREVKANNDEVEKAAKSTNEFEQASAEIIQSLKNQSLALEGNEKAVLENTLSQSLNLEQGQKLPKNIQSQVDAYFKLKESIEEQSRLEKQYAEFIKERKEEQSKQEDDFAKQVEADTKASNKFIKQLEIENKAREKRLQSTFAKQFKEDQKANEEFVKQLQKNQDEYDKLEDKITGIGSAWGDAGNVIINTFGSISDVLSKYTSDIERLDKIESKIAEERLKDGADLVKLNKLQEKVDKERSETELSNLGSLAGATASFFDEKTTAFKAFNALNQALTAVEIALEFQKLAASNATTTATVANEGVKAEANALSAITAAFSAPFPIGFAAGAAMIGIMGALLGKTFGGGSSGGSSGGQQPVNESESVEKASEQALDIEFDQLAELRAIRDSVGDIARGSSELAALVESGIPLIETLRRSIEEPSQVDSPLLEDDITEGGNGGGSDRSQINQVIRDIVSGIQESVSSAAESLGLELEAEIGNLIIPFGSIDLDGLDADEIEAELNKLFGEVADNLVESVLPSINEFRKAGEGLFETLVRVAKEQAIFNDALDFFGQSIDTLANDLQVGVGQSIIDLVGGIDNFSDLTSEFFDEFLSEEQQFESLTNSLTEALSGLGLGLFETREEFTDLLNGIDLTTESGQALFAALLELVPALDQYFDAVEEGEDKAREAAEELIRIEEDLAERRINLNKSISDRLEEIGLDSFELGLLQLEREFESLRQEAIETGGDLTAIERLYGELRQGILDDQLNEQLAIEQAAADELLRIEQEAAAEQARIRQENLNNAIATTDSALTQLSNAVGRQQDLLADSLAEDLEQIELSGANALDSLAESADSASNNINSLSSLLGSITNTIQKLTPQTRGQAQSEVRSAIDLARSGGSLAGVDLSRALNTLSDPSEDLFGSFEDYLRDFNLTNNALSELGSLTEGQLTTEEQTLNSINSQVEAVESDTQLQLEQRQSLFDREFELLGQQLIDAENQLNALRGIDTTVLDISDAQDALNDAINAEALILESVNNAIEKVETGQALLDENISEKLTENQYLMAEANEIAAQSNESLVSIGESVVEMIEVIKESPIYDVPVIDNGLPIQELPFEIMSRTQPQTSNVQAVDVENSTSSGDVVAILNNINNWVMANAMYNKVSRDLLEDWDGNGLPEERTV